LSALPLARQSQANAPGDPGVSELNPAESAAFDPFVEEGDAVEELIGLAEFSGPFDVLLRGSGWRGLRLGRLGLWGHVLDSLGVGLSCQGE
jgi:hypothetical protein